MMRKMNIYDKIKNPLDSDKLLKKIVEVFLSSNSQDEMYSNAVEYGEKDVKFNEREFYRFKRMIDKQELNNIRSFKRKEVKKDNIKAKLANFVKSDGILSHIKKVNLAALDYLRFNPPTYKMYEYVKNHTNNEILNKYEEIKQGKKHFNKEDRLVLSIIDGYIMNKHNFSKKNIAGYHVYQDELEKKECSDLKDKYKIYLNINYNQLYKFAAKYMEICRKTNVEYNFKVMAPISDVPNRSEKMCIYCNEKNFYQTIDIIKAIKSANPELKTGKPPIFAGVLDKWIGIGSDPKGTSYNYSRSECIWNALSKVFKDVSKEKAKKVVLNNPSILNKIRKAIKIEANSMSIATDKFCFDKKGNNRIRKIDRKYKNHMIRLDKKKLKIEGLNNFEEENNHFRKSLAVSAVPVKRIGGIRRIAENIAQTVGANTGELKVER